MSSHVVAERLQPVIDGVPTEMLGFRPPRPPADRLELVDAWIGT